jgi:hypothetical protein
MYKEKSASFTGTKCLETIFFFFTWKNQNWATLIKVHGCCTLLFRVHQRPTCSKIKYSKICLKVKWKIISLRLHPMAMGTVASLRAMHGSGPWLGLKVHCPVAD